MKPLLALALFFAILSIAQAQQDKYEFPSKDQIQLILTQADRAMTQYEGAIKLESTGGPHLEASAKTDLESLHKVRQILDPLIKNPEAFNGPPGFLIVTGLDDASRNMALCMGQAGMQANTLLEIKQYTEAQRLLQVGQSCMDTSTLIFTVSESALDAYGNYLLAEYAMAQDAAAALTQCNKIIQNGCKQK